MQAISPEMRTADTSKSTIRQEARIFSQRWAGTASEAAEKQTFWNELLSLFGIDRKQVAAFEALASRASTGNHGWVDLVYPNQMAVEHKSAGEDLDKAMDQLFDYLPRLIDDSITPWLLVVCDFNNFKWKNLDNGTSGEFSLSELPDNIHLFWWMAGHESPIEAFESEEACNLKATEIMASLHDELKSSGYPEQDRKAWMTRILFCMFADDTDVWDRAAFHAYVAHQTRIDGSDLGSKLAEVFQILNTPPSNRSTLLSEELQAFSYINGDLFSESISIPSCNSKIRSALLKACQFNWEAISPAIFGSMFQNVMHDIERRKLGAHYTEEEKIMRVIGPLFLDELKAELESCTTLVRLRDFHEKLARLTFFDPACGCGNFLIIAYREIRRLEHVCIGKIMKLQVRQAATTRRRLAQRQLTIDLELFCKVSVSQFYGIEIEEFPARIARTALYLIDHIANREVSRQLGQYYARFPIHASSTIVIGNALQVRWDEILPAEKASYLLGNPPFIGISLRSEDQTADLQHVWGPHYHGTLDYVTGWYKKAVDYIGANPVRAAFVSTNSICQGEQVAPLWGYFFSNGFKIDFAHRTFKWTSEAEGAANVHCIIIGFSRQEIDTRRRIFDYPDILGQPVEINARNITCYLIDFDFNLIVEPSNRPLSDQLPEVRYGNKPTDNGGLLISPNEYDNITRDPIAAKYIRRYVGAREMLHGEDRWCLWLVNAPPGEIRQSKILSQRVKAVRDFRLASKAASTVEAAEKASIFRQITQPTDRFLCIPIHVSEKRQYFTVDYYDAEVIASNAAFIADDPTGLIFSILSSSMFMAWFRAVGGRIKSDLRFNKLLVYNTFPMPHLPDRDKKRIEAAGREILNTRSQYPNTCLADLYDLPMRAELVDAHKNLNRAVDQAFGIRKTPITEYARVRRLFELYDEALTPLRAQVNPTIRRRR